MLAAKIRIEECVYVEATVEQAHSTAFMALLPDYGPVAIQGKEVTNVL